MSAPHLLIYDIPDAANIPNPTVWLREIAVRINKSVWVVQEDNIPYRRLRELERAGASWYTLPFDTKAMGDITKLVVENLTKDIRGVVERSRASCQAYTEQMERSTSSRSAPERIVAHRRKVAPVIKKMGATLLQLKRAARTFGVDESNIGYVEAAGAVGSLKTAMLERAKAYLEAAAELEKISPGDLMAKAARNGKVPARILSDYCQDRGLNATGEKLFKLF